ERAAASTTAKAAGAVELDRRVAQLAAEAADAPYPATLHHDAGAEARARGQQHQRAGASADTEPPLGQRQGIHVVVDEDRQLEAPLQQLGQRQAGQLRHVRHGLTDTARDGARRARHAHADATDVVAQTLRAQADALDQLLDDRHRTAGPVPVRGGTLLEHDAA